jgi:hypothetical protein
VADSSVLEWYAYGYTVFAGVLHLLFRKPGTSTSEVPHSFVLHPAAESTAVLRRDVDAKLPAAAAAADGSGELVPASSEGSADFEARLALEDEDVLPSGRKAAHHKDQQAAAVAAAKPTAAAGARPDAAKVDA